MEGAWVPLGVFPSAMLGLVSPDFLQGKPLVFDSSRDIISLTYTRNMHTPPFNMVLILLLVKNNPGCLILRGSSLLPWVMSGSLGTNGVTLTSAVYPSTTPRFPPPVRPLSCTLDSHLPQPPCFHLLGGHPKLHAFKPLLSSFLTLLLCSIFHLDDW